MISRLIDRFLFSEAVSAIAAEAGHRRSFLLGAGAAAVLLGLIASPVAVVLAFDSEVVDVGTAVGYSAGTGVGMLVIGALWIAMALVGRES